MMQKYCKLFMMVLFFIFMLHFAPVPSAHAQIGPIQGKGSVSAHAMIGEYYLDISGYIAPFASVILSTDGIVMRSTVADAQGNFFISQVLIKQGFSHFCLEAIDVKRLGESEVCFSFPAANGNLKFPNLFLPPTLGLYKTQINVASTAIAWGYSMPGALVTLHLSDGRVLTTTARSDGFYQFNVPFLIAGTFTLTADAQYQKKNSLKSINQKALTVLSVPQQIANQLIHVQKNLFNLLQLLGPLLLAIPILILIIILLKKLWPDLFPFIPEIPGSALPAFFDVFKKRQEKLHHFWMKGVGF